MQLKKSLIPAKKVAILGSSPISLFEALYQHKIGNEVVVLEQKNDIGGAWGSKTYNNEYEFEVGCHIWDVDKNTYKFIEDFIREPLEVLNPPPIIIYKNRKIPYDLKHNLLIFKAIKQDFIKYFTDKKFIKPRLKPRKYKYPKNGSKELLNRLSKELDDNNIPIKSNTDIKSIDLSNERCILKLNDTEINCDEVIITSLAGIKNIKTDNSTITVKNKKTKSLHYHLLIEGELQKKISYARLINHKYIHRVSDITDFSNTDHRVLSIGLYRDEIVGWSDAEVLANIKELLLKHQWIENDSKIVEHFKSEYEFSVIDHFQINELNKLDNLTILRTTNFIYGLGRHIERWREQLLN